MAMFLVELHRSEPRWESSLPLEQQSDWAAHATFMDDLVDGGFIVHHALDDSVGQPVVIRRRSARIG